MNERLVGKMMGPLARRVQNLLARGTVVLSNAATMMQTLQVKLLAGETLDGLEHFEAYGFTSRPKAGAEVATLFVDGDRSHGLVLVAADRRYRMKSFEEGEVAIYDDQGQSVHLTRAGIVVKGAGLPMVFEDTPSITMKASAFIRFEAPRVEATQLLMSMQYQMGGVSGGSGALTATYGAGTVIWNGVNLQATGGSLRHDGKDFGSTHTHGGVQTGSDDTDTPNP